MKTNENSVAGRIEGDTYATIEIITPERAQEILSRNTRNFRKLSEARARSLADVMKRGHFKFNGEKIHIRSDGSVADGQTRLRACVIAGVPFKTVVVHGDVEDESNIDTGSKRTAGQLLQFHGVVNANSTAAAVKAYIALFERRTISHLSYSAPISSSEVLMWFEKHKGIEHSVRLAANVPKGMYQALVAAVHFAGAGIDKEHTDWWINALISGEDLTADDPVLKLRNRFITSGKRVMISRVEQAALIIKSWNLSREGRPVRLLQWRGAGPNPEPFPVLGEREEPLPNGGEPALDRLEVSGPDDALAASPAAARLVGQGQEQPNVVAADAETRVTTRSGRLEPSDDPRRKDRRSRSERARERASR